MLQRQQDLYALYLWIQDWTDTARAVITNRAELISLGIAKRRQTKQPQVPPPVVTPPAPAPVGAAPQASQPQVMVDEGPVSRAA